LIHPRPALLIRSLGASRPRNVQPDTDTLVGLRRDQRVNLPFQAMLKFVYEIKATGVSTARR
jgi:hypothetical protein